MPDTNPVTDNGDVFNDEDIPIYEMPKDDRIMKYASTLQVPPGYFQNSVQEDLLIELVLHFREQFTHAFSDRSVPLLTPANECGARKFLSTFIRPTVQSLGMDFWDIEPLASFVANFVRYHPLENDEFPDAVQSPSTTLQWQAGDCLDLAILLCSLLNGSSFNAYVAIGYATEPVALADLSSRPAPSRYFANLLAPHVLVPPPERASTLDHPALIASVAAAEARAATLTQNPCTGAVYVSPNAAALNFSRPGEGDSETPGPTPPAGVDGFRAVAGMLPGGEGEEGAPGSSTRVDDSAADAGGSRTESLGAATSEYIVPAGRYAFPAPPPRRVAAERMPLRGPRVEELEPPVARSATPPSLGNFRRHAWVVLLPGGPRGVTVPTYVEPTTGDVIPLVGGPRKVQPGSLAAQYGGVEALVSDVNMWVYAGPDAPRLRGATPPLVTTTPAATVGPLIGAASTVVEGGAGAPPEYGNLVELGDDLDEGLSSAVQIRSIAPASFVLADAAHWEPVIFGDAARARVAAANGPAFTVDRSAAIANATADGGGNILVRTASGRALRRIAEFSRVGAEGDRVLALPSPWPLPVAIDAEQTQLRFPGRRKELEFGDATVALSAYGEEPDCRVVRIRVHATGDEHVLFGPREDRLARRSFEPATGTTAEWFLPGRRRNAALEALRCIAHTPGVRRDVWFYLGARTDGLYLRSEVFAAPSTLSSTENEVATVAGFGARANRHRPPDIRVRTVELYHGRADRLLSRTVKYDAHADTSALPTSIALRHGRDTSIPSHEDVEWYRFVSPGTANAVVQVAFFFGRGAITRPTQTLRRNRPVEVVSSSFVPDPSPAALATRMRQLFLAEKTLLVEVADANEAARALLAARAQEAAAKRPAFMIYRPLVDTALANETVAERRPAGPRTGPLDPLARFILRKRSERTAGMENEPLNAAEAREIYRECLADFRARAKRREAVLVERLKAEQASLQRLQQALQRAQETESPAAAVEECDRKIEEGVWKVALIGPLRKKLRCLQCFNVVSSSFLLLRLF